HSWHRNADHAVRRLAHTHIRMWQSEALSIQDFLKRKEVMDFAMRQERSGSFDAMLKEARVLDPIQTQGPWDDEPWLLGCPNGLVDLKTGKLRPGERSDMVTKTVGIEFDADAACPRWEQFIDQVFAGDPELAGYVQRAVGYSLTGVLSEQCFFMAH